jgi:conjugal transfer pilus assembly protein TraV
MRTEYKIAALAAALIALSGCAVGSSKYGCAGMPEGTQCASARDVYEMTETTDRVTRSGQASAAANATAGYAGEKEFAPAILPAANGAIPLRTPSQVMRIRLNFWEDERGDMHVPGHIYTEIEPRTWQVGMPAVDPTPVLRPLVAPASN